MPIRVRVQLKRDERVVDGVALVNSGYEAPEEPEIHLPLKLVSMLGFKLKERETYRAVGVNVEAYILGYIDVRVVEAERSSSWIRARAVCTKDEYEILLSDHLTESLGIEPIKPASGYWRFSGEEKLRPSAKPQYWI